MSAGTRNHGIWYGVAAYALWGVFPIYFKQLGFVDAEQIIAHRIVWSFVLLALIAAPSFAGGRTREPFGITRRNVGLYGLAAMLIALNWFIYVWAVTHGFIVETSLGYFITPLVQVVIGVAVLGERLRSVQWAAVALAAAGVGYLAFVYGHVPWMAMGLAASFGTYSLVKKTAPLGSVAGLTLETGILFLPALVFLLFVERRGDGAFHQVDAATKLLIASAGPITALPLVLFAAAVQRMPLSAVGLLQFFSPTIQFLIGIVVYKEPFTRQQLVGFALVWCAVIVFATEGILVRAQQRTAVLNEGEF
jgi:chloramphenicol-sensitive protein RarD